MFDILNGKTPLHFAAMQSNPRSLELLLALEGIEVNIEDMIFLSLFNTSVFSKKNFFLISFLKKFYKTPLHYASRFGHLENVKLLLQHKDIAINPQVILIKKKFIQIFYFYCY